MPWTVEVDPVARSQQQGRHRTALHVVHTHLNPRFLNYMVTFDVACDIYRAVPSAWR
jgi:hypothetical protein